MADSTGFFDHGHDHNIDQDDHLTIFAADYPSLNSSGYASAAFTPLANSKHDSPIEAVTPVKNEDSINFGIGHLHDSPDATSPIHASSVQISSSQASPTQLSPKKFSSKSSRRSSAKKDRHGPRRSGYSQRYKMESSRSACKPCRKRKCNGGDPCYACLDRHTVDECEYDNPKRKHSFGDLEDADTKPRGRPLKKSVSVGTMFPRQELSGMARTPATPATPFTPGTPFTPVTPVTPVTPTANAVSLNLESFHISTLDKAALLDQLMAIAEDQRAKAIRIVKVTGGTNALENALTPTVEPHPFEWFVENVIHDPSSHVLLFGATVLPATHGFIKSQPVLNPATIREASGFDLSPTGRPDAYTRDGIKNAKLVAQLLQAFCDNLVSPAFVLDKKVLTGKLEYNNDAAGLVYALCSYTTLLPIAASVLDPTKFSCRPTVVALSDGFFHEAKDHLSKAVFPTCYDVIALTVMSMRESLLGKELAHDYALRATKLAGDVGLYGSFGSTTQDARMRETSLWGAFAQEVFTATSIGKGSFLTPSKFHVSACPAKDGYGEDAADDVMNSSDLMTKYRNELFVIISEMSSWLSNLSGPTTEIAIVCRYNKLQKWYQSLPQCLQYMNSGEPDVVALNLTYNANILNLLEPFLATTRLFDQLHPGGRVIDIWSTVKDAAIAIHSLVRLLRDQDFNIGNAHPVVARSLMKAARVHLLELRTNNCLAAQALLDQELLWLDDAAAFLPVVAKYRANVADALDRRSDPGENWLSDFTFLDSEICSPLGEAFGFDL